MSQKNNTTISARMTKLQELLAWFDSDDFSLEKAIDVYNDALVLASGIERDLNELKNDIQILKKKFDE